MSIHTTCRLCSSPVSAPDTAGGTIVSCPHCQGRIRLPKSEADPSLTDLNDSKNGSSRLTPLPSRPGNDDQERGPRNRQNDEAEDDRQSPRYSRMRPKRNGGLPVWAMLLAAGLLAIVLGVGGYFTIRAMSEAIDNSAGANSGKVPQRSPAEDSGDIFGITVKKTIAGKEYIPRVCEEKFTQFLKNHDGKDVTEEQVYEIMGEPTRREAPVTGRKNGMTFTTYKAYWEVPSSGITSQIIFSNGRMAGMILGLKTSPGGSDKGP